MDGQAEGPLQPGDSRVGASAPTPAPQDLVQVCDTCGRTSATEWIRKRCEWLSCPNPWLCQRLGCWFQHRWDRHDGRRPPHQSGTEVPMREQGSTTLPHMESFPAGEVLDLSPVVQQHILASGQRVTSSRLYKQSQNFVKWAAVHLRRLVISSRSQITVRGRQRSDVPLSGFWRKRSNGLFSRSWSEPYFDMKLD